MQALPGNLPENGTDCWLARTLRLPTPMCISTAATSGADNRPEATHGGCLWNEMNYAPPFDALRQDICKAATAYTHFLVFDGMRIKHKYFDEAVPYIDTAVKQTKRLKQISDAAFQRQDIDEIESIALALRKEIEAALQPFYMRHMCLYVTPECFDDPPKTPEVYNDATACVWRDGTWQLLEDTSEGFLLFVQSKSKEEAAA